MLCPFAVDFLCLWNAMSARAHVGLHTWTLSLCGTCTCPGACKHTRAHNTHATFASSPHDVQCTQYGLAISCHNCSNTEWHGLELEWISFAEHAQNEHETHTHTVVETTKGLFTSMLRCVLLMLARAIVRRAAGNPAHACVCAPAPPPPLAPPTALAKGKLIGRAQAALPKGPDRPACWARPKGHATEQV